MNELERLLDKLQSASHETKKLIMWIGVPIVMAVIIFIWLSYTDFGFKEEAATNMKEEVSKFEILKNGFIVTLKEARDLLKDFKEKIYQTNTFEITAPQQNENDNSISATTTQINKILENTGSDTKMTNN